MTHVSEYIHVSTCSFNKLLAKPTKGIHKCCSRKHGMCLCMGEFVFSENESMGEFENV